MSRVNFAKIFLAGQGYPPKNLRSLTMKVTCQRIRTLEFSDHGCTQSRDMRAHF